MTHLKLYLKSQKSKHWTMRWTSSRTPEEGWSNGSLGCTESPRRTLDYFQLVHIPHTFGLAASHRCNSFAPWQGRAQCLKGQNCRSLKRLWKQGKQDNYHRPISAGLNVLQGGRCRRSQCFQRGGFCGSHARQRGSAQLTVLGMNRCYHSTLACLVRCRWRWWKHER